MKRSIVAAAVAAAFALSYTFLIKASVPQPSNTWAATGEMSVGRAGASATLMYDGRILVTGGTTGGGVSASAEGYSPAAGTFTTAPAMLTARANHTSSLLPDGRVLVAGGVGANGQALNAAEIYDPATIMWTPAPPMPRARRAHGDGAL